MPLSFSSMAGGLLELPAEVVDLMAAKGGETNGAERLSMGLENGEGTALDVLPPLAIVFLTFLADG